MRADTLQVDLVAGAEYFYHVTWPQCKESICKSGLHPDLARTLEGVQLSYKSDDGSYRSAIYLIVLEKISEAFQTVSSKKYTLNTEWVVFRVPAGYVSKCAWEYDESPDVYDCIKVHQQIPPEHLEMTEVSLNLREYPPKVLAGIAIEMVQTAAWLKVVRYLGG